VYFLRQIGLAALVVSAIGTELAFWIERWRNPIWTASFFLLIIGAGCVIAGGVAGERKRLR